MYQPHKCIYEHFYQSNSLLICGLCVAVQLVLQVASSLKGISRGGACVSAALAAVQSLAYLCMFQGLTDEKLTLFYDNVNYRNSIYCI